MRKPIQRKNRESHDQPSAMARLRHPASHECPTRHARLCAAKAAAFAQFGFGPSVHHCSRSAASGDVLWPDLRSSGLPRENGVQRYYVRLGAAYIAFGPQANVTPYIDHIATGVMDFVEADFGKPEVKAELTAAGLAAPPGVLPMLSDPDQLRLQLVNATHGLFDTLMPGGRVVTDPPAMIPIGLDHIMLSVTDVEKSVVHYRKLFGAESHASAIRGGRGSSSPIPGLAWRPRPPGRSRASHIFASRSQGLTVLRPRIAFKSSASKWSRVARKTRFGFGTYTTFRSKFAGFEAR